VVSAGPAAADDTLRQAVALGARALRVPWPPGGTGPGHSTGPGAGVSGRFGGKHSGRAGGGRGAGEPLGSDREYLYDLAADESALAGTLAAAIRTVGEPALVLCGDRSSDRGTGALPALLAHELGAAQALGLVDLRHDGDVLVGERRLDGGRRERLRIPRPAVCSVEAAGVRLRRASLPSTLAAARAEIPLVDPALAGAARRAVTVRAGRPYRPRPRVVPPPSGIPRERLMQLTGALVAHEPPTLVGPVGAAEAADALLAFLARTGYLADSTELSV
jgi:electron transfer flavoprotein beta subunit